jgi:hypothetical protein
VLAGKRLFEEIDNRWNKAGGGPLDGRVPLSIIGSAALMMQSHYDRATTDSDVLETAALRAEAKARLLQLAGQGTELHMRHGIYIQVVHGATPFLPQVPRWHPVPELDRLVHLDVTVLDVVDVVVSKLKRLHAKDIADISAMIELGLVPHAKLVERFQLAVDWIAYDARAEELPRYCANLNQIERDVLAVGETAIELPSWIR